ncbi:MAG: GTP-binding protein [Hyphomicrobium sp.]|nr:GTP-binding protein [Hyphomicrobium sp.]
MIPVTVLTGFLGSGKTTLLARLLKSPELARTAVIINEFGAVGIDHDLVEAGEESFVQLETGCLCCTIRGDLEATMADLVARRARGAVPAFERIVIETSGLADPAPILNAIMSESARGSGLALGAVVTTVDAVTGLATLSREAQSARQIAVADRLVLTKTDLAGQSADLRARLAALNPRAKLSQAIFGEIDPAGLLDSERNPIRDLHVHAHHAHSDDIQCITICREEPLRALTLTLLLEALADHCGANLLRLKGIINIAESPGRPAVIHGVQHVFHAQAWLDRWPSADQGTRLVMIGRKLSEGWVLDLIAAIEAEIDELAVQQTSAG